MNKRILSIWISRTHHMKKKVYTYPNRFFISSVVAPGPVARHKEAVAPQFFVKKLNYVSAESIALLVQQFK